MRECQAPDGHDLLMISDDELVDGVYRALLGREADTDGRTSFKEGLGQDGNLEVLIRNILSSPEYNARMTRERDDVEAFNARLADEVYRAILNREPDPAGKESFLGALRMGRNIGELVAELVRSEEFQSRAHAGCLVFATFKPVCTLLAERLKLWVDLHDAHVSLGCLLDNYEPAETRFVMDRLAPGDTFVDIGANVGWFTIHAADRVGPTGRVHSFEPRTQTHSLLTRSIADNGFEDRCTVHKLALGAEQAQSRLVWMPGTENPGGSRLVRDATEFVDDMEGEPIRMAPLDSIDIQGKVPVVKLDVEGAEAMVLGGARQFLARHRPVILTEIFGFALRHVSQVDVPQFVELIQSNGYRVHGLAKGEIGKPITDLAALETPGPISCVLVPVDA